MTDLELMEQELTEETTEVIEGTMEEDFETESGGGLGVALAVGAGLLTLGGLAVAGIKKLKSNKEDKPKKPKTKLKFFVRVPVEEVEETEAPAEEIVEEDDK